MDSARNRDQEIAPTRIYTCADPICDLIIEDSLESGGIALARQRKTVDKDLINLYT